MGALEVMPLPGLVAAPSCRTGGFDVYENTLLPSHTVSGSAVTNGTPLVTGTPGTTVTTNAWVATTSVDTDG